MILEVVYYHEFAAKVKGEIRKQGWSGMGLRYIKNESRLTSYWIMAIIYVVIGVVLVRIEDFPGGVQKPIGVYYYDMVFLVIEFLLEVAHWYVWGSSRERYWFVTCHRCCGVCRTTWTRVPGRGIGKTFHTNNKVIKGCHDRGAACDCQWH